MPVIPLYDEGNYFFCTQKHNSFFYGISHTEDCVEFSSKTQQVRKTERSFLYQKTSNDVEKIEGGDEK